MRARSSRMKDNNSNELNDEQPSCKNSKPLIPKTEVNGPKDDKKDSKSNMPDDEIIRHTTDIDKKEDKEIQTDTIEKPCIYKESSTNTDEEGLDSWTRAVGLETLYQVVVREHQDLQRAHQALLAKLKAEQRARLDLEAPIKTREENPINLALAAQIEELTARQEELISENLDLREQNDLLEFRLLEMDSAPASLHFKTAPASPSRSPESRGGDREVDDVSDSGVLSLPTSEDISEADFHDLAMEPSSRDIKFKLAQLCLSIENVTDKVSIQQGLSLLRHYEVRLETALNTLSQDSLSVRSLTSPDSVISSETSKSQSRIIATVLPFTDLSQSCGKQKDDVPLKKLFKDADCLQESGIFEESPEYCSRCTQTDCSSAKLETTGDLSLEIRKLKQIQERIEEQGSNKRLLRANVNEGNGLSAESKELAFYRERVEMLENKLAIYESSGDEQMKKMNLRLDREILLSAEIKHLKERCRMLEELNRKLEEEKCEYEEAENDTRLRCQKLEVKLSALGEKKSDLQVQLQQNARTMSNLRSCLAEEERKRIEARQHASRMENLVQHYEQRNFELEEKEIESRCRAQMLEKTIPALKVYNTWKVANAICQSAGRNSSSHKNNSSSKMIMSPSEVDVGYHGGDDRSKSYQNHKRRCVRNSLVPSYETEIGDQCMNHHELSTIDESDCIDQDDDYEDYLHDRIKQLELAIKCKEELQQQSLSPDQKNSLILKIQELKKTNCDLECRLKDLELKEGYYKQTLQQADEMWANMEGGYKQQLRELENKLDDKQNEIYEFEAMVRKLSCEKEMRQQLQERTCSLESEMKDYRFKIAEKECERKLLEKERLRLTEELEHTNEEFNYLKHVIEPSLRQQLEEHKKMAKELKREIESLEKDREQEIEDRLAEVSGLKRKMNKLGKELLENECTIGELREEVQTLEMAVIELREKLEDVHDKHEREVMKMTMEIDDKSREIQFLKEKSTCEMKLPKSARQELEEAERQMQSCNSKDPSTSTACDQKPPKRHRKHKVISPHSTLRKLNEKIRAGLLKDDKKVLKNCDSQLGGEHLTDNISKTVSISRIPTDSLLAEIRDSTSDRSAIDLRKLPQDVEVHASKCVNVESGCNISASEHCTSFSSAIESKEDKELHVDAQSTESTPNSNTQLEKQISEKMFKHNQTDSSYTTESDEPFITPPQTPERKKRSDSHGRNSHKDHYSHKKHSKSSSSSMDSTQILICDNCLLKKKYILACISCGREIGEEGEGFSAYRTSTSSSDLEAIVSSQHMHGVKNHNNESEVPNENHGNASVKSGSDAAGLDHKLGDRNGKTDRNGVANQDLEGKDRKDDKKSYENGKTDSSNEEGTDSDGKDKDGDQTKDKNEKTDKKDEKDEDSDSKGKDGDNEDNSDDSDGDSNDDDKGDSSSKDPNNKRDSNSKDKDQGDDNGRDGNSRNNSSQGSNGEGGNDSTGGKDLNSDNQSDSNSNQAGKSIDGDNNKDNRANSDDGKAKENSVSGRDQEHSEEAEGSSKLIEMDLETFYVFMNPTMMSNHFFKIPVPDAIPIYKPRYYDSTLARTTDLFDGGPALWNSFSFSPYSSFKDQLAKRYIDGNDLKSFSIGKRYMKNETTSITNLSISDDKKPMANKKAEDVVYHSSSHTMKKDFPSTTKFNNQRNQLFCYDQNRSQFSSVPSELPSQYFHNSNKLFSRECAIPNKPGTKVTSEKLIELLINEDFRTQNQKSNTTLLANKGVEKNCLPERKQSLLKNNDCSFKDSLLSLLAFDTNVLKTESQKSDFKMLERRNSDDKKCQKTSKLERTLFQSSSRQARSSNDSIRKSKIHDNDNEMNDCYVKRMGIHDFELNVKEVIPKSNMGSDKMKAQSCEYELRSIEERCNELKHVDLVDHGRAKMDQKKESHESVTNLELTKNKAGKVSPLPSSNSLLMFLTNLIDGIYLKLFNEILIRIFENNSISLESHGVILKLYKNSLCSMLNGRIDRQQLFKNINEIENAFSEILKCFVSSKSVEIVENLVSRVLLQLRKPYRNECDLYVQNMNPITFVANYMESAEIIVVGLVARQITRLLKSVSIGKTNKILDSFLNQLNLLKPILGISNAQIDECDAVVEKIQELVLFFLEGICDPSNMRDALELVDIHLAIIDNIKSVKSKKEERNCLIQYLLENMSSVNISSHLNDVKNSESEIYLEKIQFQNTKRDVISSNLHKENESLCLKKVFNSMIVFRKLRKALGLTLKHVTDAITANKVKRFVSYYKDVCETLLCEHSTTNPDLKPIVIELEGEVKFILQFIDRQFLDIVQNIDCESSRACLLVDLEYMFDDHFRILNCLVSEMSVADDNRQDETSTCFRSEKEFDSTAAQNNTRVKSPLSEKKKEMCLNLVEKKTSLRSKSKVNHEGNAKNHESELPASTKHKVLNRPGRTKSKLIQGSTQVNKNDLIIIGKSIAHEQPQCFSKGSNNNNVSPSELYSKESNNDEKSNNNGSKNPNSNTFLDGNRKSDKLGTGTSKFDGENTSQVNLSPSFDLFCFIPKALTAAQTCDVSSNRKLPFGFKECNFIDDPNLELAKKVLNRSLERLVRSYDRADLKSYLQCLLLEIDHFLEPEHRTKTHYIENSVHLDQSQFLPRTVSDIKKFLTQCALKANKDHEIEHLKSEISQYISLYCKSEIRKCCRNEQTDSVVNLSALPSISVDGIRVSYNIIENRDLRENSDELLKQVPSKILNISDQSDVPPPPTSFNLPGTNFNKTSCLDSTSFHLDRIGREDDVTNIQSALNYSYSENDNDKPVQNICVGIKDYFNHCKSTMAQNTYKSFSSQYLENILSSLKTSENNNDKTEENIEVNIRDYFNHCKSTMTQDNYESFSSQYFENILESLNTHSTYMKSLEPINVPREYRNQQVYAVVEDMDGPQQENIPKEETVVAEVVDGHTASEQRESIASQILLSVVDDVTMEDQVIKSNTHVKLRDNWEDLCSLECHWPVIMKYRTGNYHYSFDQIGECDVECSEPIRMKYPLASESKEKEKLGVVFEEEESKLGGLQSLLYECLKKIKYDERLGNMKALLKSLIEHGHPPRSDDDSLIVTADEAARAIIKSDEEPQEKTCCDVCPIYCPCCIYNKNNPSSEFFVKNLQNDLKSKLDSLSGENENASSVADSRNADVDADNNQSLKDSSQEEIVQKFIMKSANDLYKDHHLPNNDFPDHEKEDLEQSESQTNNYSDPSGSKTKQPQEIAEESDLDQLEKNLNSSLNEIHEDPHTDNNKSKDSSNYIGLKQDDFQTNIDNNLTDHKHSNDINNEPIQEENTFESPKTSIPSTDETEITIVKTGSLENTHVLNKQEEIQNLDEHAVTTDDELSTGNIGETLVKNGEIEKDDSDKNIGDENDSKKKKCKKVGKKETDEKSGKPFDQTVSKNGTNLIGDSQNIAKDVKGEIRDTNGGLETSDINDNSKTEEYSLSEGVSKESDTSRNKPIDKINSGGGEPACRHERNCPHRRMNNLPDLDEPCDNDGNFEPPSVISLLSSLNILKTKIIVKDQIIQCLADQLIQMAQEGCLWKNDMFECISSQPSKRYVDFDSAMVADYLAGYVYEKPNKQPCVYVNDELVERIRDPDVLATIVSNLDTRFVNLITVVMLDLDCIHCLMDTICISAVNSKKQNKISNYYQSLVTDDENSTSSSSEEVPNVNRKVERESLKFRVLKRKKKKL